MSIPGYEAESAFIEKCRQGGRIPCEQCGRYCRNNPQRLCYYCRTGRTPLTAWSKCYVCGRKCIDQPDGLCGQCRKAGKGVTPVEWDHCSHCGRKCHRRDDGLCAKCRRLTPQARHRHADAMKRYRLNQDRKQ